jgi:glycosyltransferase involved in cell wall biosynthesis
VLFLPERARIEPRGVEVVRLPIPLSPSAARIAAERIHLPRAAKGSGVGLLDTDHYPIPPLPRGIRLVATVHDLRALADLPGIALHRRLFARRVYRSSLAKADAIVAVSEFTASEIAGRLGIPRGRVSVVPNAADHLRAPETPPAAGGFLLHVGHLEPRKNLDLLVEALPPLQRRGLRPRLLLVGREGRRGTVRSLRGLAARLGVGDLLDLPGARSDSELATLYASCLAAIFPSLYEGFGIPLLEAMRCGALVLASNAGAHPEVAAEAALLFDPRDPEDLASRIASAATGGATRERLVEAGKRRAAQFSWRNSAGNLAAVYRSISR